LTETFKDLNRMDDIVDLAAVRFSANPLSFSAWPPTRGDSEASKDPRRLAMDRLEGRRSGAAGAREIPNLEIWPYYEADISELALPPLSEGADELKGYRVLDFSQSLDAAFALANRWRQENEGRSLGFTQTGASLLSSSVATAPILMRQLQGLAVYGKHRAAEDKETGSTGSATTASLEQFLQGSGADDGTAAELRAVVTGGTAELPEIRVSALLGVQKGSAMAVWAVERETVRVEFLLGHDCLEQGPEAEQDLLRLVLGRAEAEKATKLRCRGRFTEDGMLFAPPCYKTLGLKRVATAEDQDWIEIDSSKEESAVDREAGLMEESAVLMTEVEVAAEAVSGLRTWLAVQGLESHLEAINVWCEEMGAASLDEVVDSREELVEALADRLSEAEREAIRQREW